MEMRKASGRRAPTKTLRSQIRIEAKRLAREGRISHSQALDHLAFQAGYTNWGELRRAVDALAQGQPVMPVNPRFAPGFLRKPFWEHGEFDLVTWFERPYIEKREDRIVVLSIDGRNWMGPSRYAECAYEEELPETIEYAKRRLIHYWTSSSWQVRPTSRGTWIVELAWRPLQDSDFALNECLCLVPSEKMAYERENLLRRIRQQRMRDFEQLFQYESEERL